MPILGSDTPAQWLDERTRRGLMTTTDDLGGPVKQTPKQVILAKIDADIADLQRARAYVDSVGEDGTPPEPKKRGRKRKGLPVMGQTQES